MMWAALVRARLALAAAVAGVDDDDDHEGARAHAGRPAHCDGTVYDA